MTGNGEGAAECIFCRPRAEHELLAANDVAVAFPAGFPVSPGHALVVPRRVDDEDSVRFADLRRGAPETKLFSFTELAPIFQPLRQALTQAPPLAEVFILLAEAWARCEVSPDPAEFAELDQGARLFARHPTVGLPIALALARHGKKAEAAAVLETSAGYAPDETTRAGVARLRAELAAAPAQSPADPASATRP